MKKIAIAWTIILVMIVTSLTTIGFILKSKHITEIMEKNMVDRAEKYYAKNSNELPTLGKTVKITSEVLKDMRFDPLLEKGCGGYTLVENTEEGFIYKGYIKCPNYVTEGYSNE